MCLIVITCSWWPWCGGGVLSGFIAVVVSPQRQIVCLSYRLPRPWSGDPAVPRGYVGLHRHLGPHRLRGLLVLNVRPQRSLSRWAGLFRSERGYLTPPSACLLVFIACLHIFFICCWCGECCRGCGALNILVSEHGWQSCLLGAGSWWLTPPPACLFIPGILTIGSRSFLLCCLKGSWSLGHCDPLALCRLDLAPPPGRVSVLVPQLSVIWNSLLLSQ